MANPETTNQDNTPLFIGNVSVKTKEVAQDAGGVIPKGAVLGVITTGQKLAIAKSGSSDGSEIPKYVTTQDIDATAGDVETEVAAWGFVNASKLVFDGSDTLNTVKDGEMYYDHLRKYGILAKDTQNLDFYDNQ